MTTTEKLPSSLGGYNVRVKWKIGSVISDMGDGIMFSHNAEGSGDGYIFSGIAIVCDGEVESITDTQFEGEE